jgi:4-hydroxybenzoate polyprenyltransferase
MSNNGVIRFFLTIGDALTYSNIFIALCVFCFTWQTVLFFETRLNYVWQLSVINSLATFILYNLQRLYHAALSQEDGRSVWLQKNRKWIFTGILLAGSMSLSSIFFFWENYPQLIALYFLLGLFSLSYFLPPFNLRKYGRLKPFFIGIVYGACSILPILLTAPSFSPAGILYLLAQTVWITAICLPFDIRDETGDAERGMRTFPVVYSLKKTKYFGYVLVLLYSTFMWLTFPHLEMILPLCAISLLTSIVIGFSHNKHHRYYFSLLTDGLILLQFAIWLWYK